jgi:serine protease Do
VSAGIISAVGRGNVGIAEYEDFLQTDAAINPGNSGGPLVDLSGRVVGINTAIASASGSNSGVGFAIPIDMAAQVMGQLVDTGKVVRGYIGLYISDIRDGLAESFGYERAGGALVQDVSPDGPGAKAGLQPGDIVFERDGEPITSATDFRNGIAATKPGTSTRLSVWRDKKEIETQAVLGEMPAGASAGLAGDSPGDAARWGLQLSDLPAQLRRDGEPGGSLVQGVLPGSPADDAGLKPGDILVSVAGKAVKNARDAQRQLLAAKSSVRVRVMREGRGMFAVLSARE